MTDYTGAASREDVLKMALELAMENFSWSEPVPHPNGMGAYRYGKYAFTKWADDIAHYDEYSQEEREKLFFVSWWNMDCLYDARIAAESFLRQNLDITDLSKAAHLYRQEVKTLHQVSVVAKEAFLGPWSGKSIADWTPEVRLREIDRHLLQPHRAQRRHHAHPPAHHRGAARRFAPGALLPAGHQRAARAVSAGEDYPGFRPRARHSAAADRAGRAGAVATR